MKDFDIIELYFNRDERAIDETQKSYGGKLMRLASGMVSLSDAQECVNDTYLAAWNSIPPTRPARFFAWLAKTCRFIVCNRIDWNTAEKRSGEEVSITSELEEILSGNGSLSDTEHQQLGSHISSFLKTLPKDKRVLFLRRYWYGFSIRELSQETGLSESNVKTTLHRIRKELQSYLIKEGVTI